MLNAETFEPLRVKSRTAARMLDISFSQWRKLRAAGETPPERRDGKNLYVAFQDLKVFAANRGTPIERGRIIGANTAPFPGMEK